MRKGYSDLRTCWLDMVTIVNSRMLALERELFGADDALGPLSIGSAVAAASTKPSLVGPISQETGSKLMGLLVEISNGTVDDTVREALRKHCERRFGASDLTKLNETMGMQLVRDFENVRTGKHEIGYNEEGCMVFSNWEG